MSILGLVFFILFFIYFIIKDPTNNIQKYQLEELIDFCTKSKSFTEYSEFITYIIYKCNRIANDSSRSRDEVEKIIARLFRKVYKENSVNSNQTAFKNLCINLLNTLKSTNISENDIFSLYDVDKFDNREIVNFKNLFINCLLSYMNLKANILSFFCICFGVLQTKLENFPLDTYLYAAASMILIIYAIGTEIKKARETKTF